MYLENIQSLTRRMFEKIFSILIPIYLRKN